MDLTVIIVNYNVKHFLEQCLLSVREASKNLEVETIVVDNHSVDNSNELVKSKFPEVKLIANKENLGFSKANNQAMKIAKGRYMLLLNPDTVVEPDTFDKTIAFMDSKPEAGGLGVRMIDGNGNFLPESKRGLPTPKAAFYKMSGISKLFPKHKKYASYHKGNLSEFEINETEILSGAFMLMRKKVLDKIGFLDESFFMYGEDIDLSYRILKAGYKNYYFPETRIIHYKGESTKKDSVNYVIVFYKAMTIFAEKHFSDRNFKLFNFLINLAIVFRASLAIFRRFMKSVYIPLIDFILSFAGIFAFSNFWGKSFTQQSSGYPEAFVFVLIPVFILIWLLSVYYSGGYDKPIKVYKIFSGSFIGTFAILIIYSLLPESIRYSRAILIFAAIWIPIVLISYRLILHFFGFKDFILGNELKKRIAIVGENSELKRVEKLLEGTDYNIEFLGFISDIIPEDKEKHIGNISRLEDIINLYNLNEVIFCSKDISPSIIIRKMSMSSKAGLEFKIAPLDSSFIIGANSINSDSDLYFVNINSINKASNKRFKRLFDFIISFIFLLLSPIIIWFFKSKIKFLQNMFRVLFNNKSLVGFIKLDNKKLVDLPNIKDGVLSPLDIISNKNISDKEKMSLNLQYSRDYKISTDLKIIIKSFGNLDK